MPATKTYQRQRCRVPFTARVADRKRGWARFCSKSCKATKQEARTGQFAAHKALQQSGGAPAFVNSRGDYEGFSGFPFSNEDGHGDHDRD